MLPSWITLNCWLPFKTFKKRLADFLPLHSQSLGQQAEGQSGRRQLQEWWGAGGTGAAGRQNFFWNWALFFYPLNFHFPIYKLINIYDHFPQIQLFSHLKPVFCQTPSIFSTLSDLVPPTISCTLPLFANPWFQPLFRKYALIFPTLSHFKHKSPSFKR